MRDSESRLLDELIIYILFLTCAHYLNLKKTDVGEKYSTKGAYEELVKQKGQRVQGEKEELRLIWNKLVPSKVQLHVWRVLLERLPTCTKLQRRNILSTNANVECIFCKKEDESVRHVFFECEYSYKLWMDCLKCLGIQTTLPSNPSMNLLLFSKFIRGKRGKMIAICLCECII